jgi:hypothetical protein
MEIEKGKVYDLIDFVEGDLRTIFYTYFDIILGIVSQEAISWDKYKTRSGIRYINEITFPFTKRPIVWDIPECFHDIKNPVDSIVRQLLQLARITITDGSELIPLQLFLCYYRNGNDVCPMHSHKCRQITLSIGADRIMTVGSKKIKLHNGSIIYLNTEKHGILKEDNVEGNRISFNLFYTTTSEMQGVQ